MRTIATSDPARAAARPATAIGVGIRLAGASLLALAAADAVALLGLLPRALAGTPLHGGWRDFLGLLLAEIPAALAVAGAGLLAGVLWRRLRGRERCGGLEAEAAAATGALGLLVVLGAGLRIRAGWSVDRLLELGPVAILGGLATWLLLRRVARGTRGKLGAPLLLVVGAPALAGGATALLAQGAAGEGRSFLLAGGLLLLCLALMGLLARGGGSGRRQAAAWTPVILATALAVGDGVAARDYGRLQPSAGPERPTAAPAVVLIVLDTVRADHLDLLGYPRPTMPALAAWAEDAAVFERAVSTAGWTTPAHASLFSGLPVSLHGIHEPGPHERGREPPARPGVRWLPELMGERGYRSVALSANKLALPRSVRGWRDVLQPNREAWHRSSLAAWLDTRAPLLRTVSERLRWRLPYADARGIVAAAERVLASAGGPPFLFVNFLDAHSPYDPPRSAVTEAGGRAGACFPLYLHHQELTRAWPGLPAARSEDLRDQYDGELRWLDRHLDRLLRRIDAAYGGRAVVVVVGDHGEELGLDGRVGHECGISQELLHVPLLIKGPGVAPGRRDDLVSIRGLFRFLVAAAEGEPDLDLLANPDGIGIVAERYPSGVGAEVYGDATSRPWVAMFADGHKGLGPSTSGFQLLDVTSAGFTTEVPADDADLAGRLRRRIDDYWRTSRDDRFLAPDSLEPRGKETLRSLGYVD